VDKLVQAGGLAHLPERGTPADGKEGPSQGGCFDSEAHPQLDRKWGTYGLGAKGRSKPRGELNKTLEDSFF